MKSHEFHLPVGENLNFSSFKVIPFLVHASKNLYVYQNALSTLFSYSRVSSMHLIFSGCPWSSHRPFGVCAGAAQWPWAFFKICTGLKEWWNWCASKIQLYLLSSPMCFSDLSYDLYLMPETMSKGFATVMHLSKAGKQVPLGLDWPVLFATTTILLHHTIASLAGTATRTPFSCPSPASYLWKYFRWLTFSSNNSRDIMSILLGIDLGWSCVLSQRHIFGAPLSAMACTTVLLQLLCFLKYPKIPPFGWVLPQLQQGLQSRNHRNGFPRLLLPLFISLTLSSCNHVWHWLPATNYVPCSRNNT